MSRSFAGVQDKFLSVRTSGGPLGNFAQSFTQIQMTKEGEGGGEKERGRRGRGRYRKREKRKYREAYGKKELEREREREREEGKKLLRGKKSFKSGENLFRRLHWDRGNSKSFIYVCQMWKVFDEIQILFN